MKNQFDVSLTGFLAGAFRFGFSSTSLPCSSGDAGCCSSSPSSSSSSGSPSSSEMATSVVGFFRCDFFFRLDDSPFSLSLSPLRFLKGRVQRRREGLVDLLRRFPFSFLAGLSRAFLGRFLGVG